MPKLKILDLGCGATKKPGSIGVDIHKLEGVDIVHDLEKFPYPFRDLEFDEVHAYNSIEHLSDTLRLFEEVYRILKSGGVFHFEVPHFSSCDMFKDPTHKAFFAYSTPEYFDPEMLLYKLCYSTDTKFKIRSRRIIFWGSRKIFDLPQELIFNKVPNFYERKLCWLFPAHQIIFDLVKI